MEEVKNTKAKTVTDPMEELVEITLFKDAEHYNDDVVVAVNGETVQIKRGVPVQIKRKFAEVLQHEAEQRGKAADLMTGLQANYKRKSRNLE